MDIGGRLFYDRGHNSGDTLIKEVTRPQSVPEHRSASRLEGLIGI